MSAVDVLIFIPLIPAISIVATWCFPWERLIPRKLPKKVIGLYLLYCTFAVWHFGAAWWAVVAVALLGIGVSVMALFAARRLRQARDWPVAEARVRVHKRQDEDGIVRVPLTYTYKVHGERYGGIGSFAFIKDEDAARFEDAYRERPIYVHYRLDKPEISVLPSEDGAAVDPEDTYFWWIPRLMWGFFSLFELLFGSRSLGTAFSRLWNNSVLESAVFLICALAWLGWGISFVLRPGSFLKRTRSPQFFWLIRAFGVVLILVAYKFAMQPKLFR